LGLDTSCAEFPDTLLVVVLTLVEVFIADFFIEELGVPVLFG